jgi:hypothetical protein
VAPRSRVESRRLLSASPRLSGSKFRGACPAETVKTVVAQLRGGGRHARMAGCANPTDHSRDCREPRTTKCPRGIGRRTPARQPGAARRHPSRRRDRFGQWRIRWETRALASRIASMAPGTSVRLGVIRDGREETVTLTGPPIVLSWLSLPHDAGQFLVATRWRYSRIFWTLQI